MGGGVNATTALYIGADDNERVHRTVNTSVLLCFAAGILLLLSGLIFTRPLLGAMNTKPELIDGAATYLMIYLCGSPALAIFNFGNGVLNAVGDTKRPVSYTHLDVYKRQILVLMDSFFTIAVMIPCFFLDENCAIFWGISSGMI